MAYMRNKPFLVVELRQQPAAKVNTRVAGWASDRANLVTTEHASVVDRIGKKHNSSAVIIDCIEGTAIKNITGKPNDEVISYYIGKHADMITDALNVWAGKMIKAGMTVEELTGTLPDKDPAEVE